MPASINPNRPTRLSRALPLALATVASGILVTGYGGSAPSPTAGCRGRPWLDRAGRRRVGARLRQLHARERRAQLPGPAARRWIPRTFWRQSRRARVPDSAGPLLEAPARRRAPWPRIDHAPLATDVGEAAQDLAMHAPARSRRVPRPQDLRPVPGRLRNRRGDRFRRSDPSVPAHS